MTTTAEAIASARPAAPGPPITRVPSIDAFRGFVMFLMLAEVMRLWTLHEAFPSSSFWAFVAYNTTHVPWQGCSLHDIIQPAFSFLAGASLPFSIASREAKGESFGRMLAHAIRRSLILVFLGIFLRSMGSPSTYWTFEDTLTQIGLGYTFLFLLAFAYLATSVSAFVLAKRFPERSKELSGRTVIPIAGAAFSLLLMALVTPGLILISVGLLLVGIPVYALFSPKKELHEMREAFLSPGAVLRRAYEQGDRFLAHPWRHLIWLVYKRRRIERPFIVSREDVGRPPAG
jgi:predicted acyltransferase